MKIKHLIALLGAFLLAAFAATVFAQISQQSNDRKTPTLDGEWIPVKAELAGQKFPEEALKDMRLTLKDGGYTVEVNGAIDKGKVELQTAANPKSMRIVGVDGPNKDRTFLAIYELNDDTLTICYNLGGESLPKEFKTETGSRFYLVTYKRKTN